MTSFFLKNFTKKIRTCPIFLRTSEKKIRTYFSNFKNSAHKFKNLRIRANFKNLRAFLTKLITIEVACKIYNLITYKS